MRRFLDLWIAAMTAIVATLIVLFWFRRVDVDLEGRLSKAFSWLVDSCRAAVDRALAGPRTVAFREWSRRFWKVEEE